MDWGEIGQLEGQRGNAYSGAMVRAGLTTASWEVRGMGIFPGMYGVILAGENGRGMAEIGKSPPMALIAPW